MRRKSDKKIEWTHDLAYAIGLITTDGNLSKDQRHITFTSTDYQLIEIFRNCLRKQNKIGLNSGGKRSRKQGYKIQISDVSFYDFLLKIGLLPCKSKVLGRIRMPNQYFIDFLRGHLDGDGSIIRYTDRYNAKINPKYIYQRLFVYFLSASRKHIYWLHNKIKKLITISGSLTRQKTNKTIMYRIKFSTKEAKIILNWIYYKPSLPCLLRKYIIAKPFLKVH